MLNINIVPDQRPVALLRSNLMKTHQSNEAASSKTRCRVFNPLWCHGSGSSNLLTSYTKLKTIAIKRSGQNGARLGRVIVVNNLHFSSTVPIFCWVRGTECDERVTKSLVTYDVNMLREL